MTTEGIERNEEALTAITRAIAELSLDISLRDLVAAAEKALDALVNATTRPCSECRRTGEALEHDPHSQSVQALRKVKCRALGCKDGQVSSPPLALLMGELEQVGWCRRATNAVRSMFSWHLLALREAAEGTDEAVYRIGSGEDT